MTEIIERYPVLKPYVNNIWVVENKNPDTASSSFKFFADGRPGIMYIESDHDIYLNVNERVISSLFLYGQTIKPIEINIKGDFRFIIFYLYPHVIKNLFKLDAHELTDTCINFSYLLMQEAKDLAEKLQEAGQADKQVELIATFILSLIAREKTVVDHGMGFATDKLLKTNGEEFLPSLQSSLNMTERTLQRKFQEHVGISPKQFARIVKFNGVFNQLRSQKFNNLADLAYEYGYADQSHFNRTFKEFTGMTPGEYMLTMKNEM